MTPIEDSDYTDGANTDSGVAKITELAAAGNPFFIAVGFKKPHLLFAFRTPTGISTIRIRST